MSIVYIKPATYLLSITGKLLTLKLKDMKISYCKFLFLLGFSGLFMAETSAQQRNNERRPQGVQRNFSQSNNQPRVQQQPRMQPQPRVQQTPGFQQQPRQNNPQAARPQRDNNFTRPQPSNTQTPTAGTQTPGQTTGRPGRDYSRPRPVRNQPSTITNPGSPVANNPGSTTPNPSPAASRPPRSTGSSYANPRAGISPLNDEARNRGRGNNTYNNRGNNNYNNYNNRRYGYNNYHGNNYFTGGYYNNRPRVVYNAYNPSWRYNYYPRRNTIVTAFPFSYSTINFGGYGYRYYDGLYYQPYNDYYRIVAPPIGIYINTLPIGYSRIYVHDNPYYYYNGTYYNQQDEKYTVVAPPVGAIVESIPEGYETVVIDGETYYKVDDVQYKPIVQDNGEIWYEVIKVG